MTPERREQLVRIYRDGLLEDTVPFWFPRCVDKQFGGFLVARDRDGSLLDDDKGVWQQGRTTWLLGKLYNEVEPRDTWLQWCRRGVEFLDRHCFDPEDGRMWFHLTRDGRPIRKRRYAFTESFAAIAYGQYARAAGSNRYAEKARQVFLNFVEHNLRPKGVQPKFTDQRPMKAIGPPMITIATCQELRDSIGLAEAGEWIDRGIEEIAHDFLKPDIQCVMENVGSGGQIHDHFDGRLLNPGHAIEAAWFIMHEGHRRDDRKLVDTGCRMLDWMWARGWDDQYGGILYFADVYGKPVQEYWHDMKFWWPHNEAIIATLLAWLLTGEEKYAQWHRAVHDWAYARFPDPEHGEWFGYLHRDGRVSVPLKGNLWKGPFHLPRMQLICWRMLESVCSRQ
ncbi:MAG: AGE family epimerase/isomerase [Planctomycetota bacterium]